MNFAVMGGSADVLAVLLGAGGNPMTSSGLDLTPLAHSATLLGSEACFQLLMNTVLPRDMPPADLHMAARAVVDALRVVCNVGVAADAAGSEALEARALALVRLLSDRGCVNVPLEGDQARPFIINEYPLHAAAEGPWASVVQALLDAGANPFPARGAPRHPRSHWLPPDNEGVDGTAGELRVFSGAVPLSPTAGSISTFRALFAACEQRVHGGTAAWLDGRLVSRGQWEQITESLFEEVCSPASWASQLSGNEWNSLLDGPLPCESIATEAAALLLPYIAAFRAPTASPCKVEPASPESPRRTSDSSLVCAQAALCHAASWNAGLLSYLLASAPPACPRWALLAKGRVPTELLQSLLGEAVMALHPQCMEVLLRALREVTDGQALALSQALSQATTAEGPGQEGPGLGRASGGVAVAPLLSLLDDRLLTAASERSGSFGRAARMNELHARSLAVATALLDAGACASALVSLVASPNPSVGQVRGALHAAALWHPALVELLLQRGADPWVDSSLVGKTPLECAAGNHNAAALHLLLAAMRASVGDGSEKQELARRQELRRQLSSALVMACKEPRDGDADAHAGASLQCLRAVIAEAGSLSSMNPHDVYYALQLASTWNTQALGELLSAGASVIVPAGYNESLQGPELTEEDLEDEGLVVTLAPRMLRCERTGRDTGGHNLLHFGCSKGYAAAIPLLVAAGETIDAANCVGNTPLMVATVLSDLESMHALIELGADLDAPNRMGMTPLHVAAPMCQPSVVSVLLNAWADPCAVDVAGATPLGIIDEGRILEPAAYPNSAYRWVTDALLAAMLTMNSKATR